MKPNSNPAHNLRRTGEKVPVTYAHNQDLETTLHLCGVCFIHRLIILNLKIEEPESSKILSCVIIVVTNEKFQISQYFGDYIFY